MYRLTLFLRADTGLARIDYVAVLVLTALAQQLVAHSGSAIGAAIRPAFGFLG